MNDIHMVLQLDDIHKELKQHPRLPRRRFDQARGQLYIYVEIPNLDSGKYDDNKALLVDFHWASFFRHAYEEGS